MKDVFSIIRQLTKQLSDSPFEEERIRELRPIDYILDYYTNPMKDIEDPRDNKKYVIEWKDEDGRIKEIERYNAIVNGYNDEIKNNKTEFFQLLPVDDKAHSPSELNYNEPIDDFDPIPLWAFNCIPKLSRDKSSRRGRLMVDDEELYKLHYDEPQDADKFVKHLNKQIFDYIQSKFQSANKKGAWSKHNMWFEPNRRFLEWFDLKDTDPESERNGIPGSLSKWAKEVVRLLLKNGEMKHQDILIELDGLPKSYNHLSKIFKTPDAKKFSQSEIVNNKSYYSLRDPSQFK